MIFICCENSCGITANQVNKTVGTHVLVLVETAAILCLLLLLHEATWQKKFKEIFFSTKDFWHIWYH